MNNWKTFANEKITEIRKVVKDAYAASALSGGVDSSTTTILGFKALRDHLYVVFIDDGLMREGEYDEVRKNFSKLGIEVELLEAQERFFKALKGKVDPEEKRKAFRHTFYETLGEYCKEKRAEYLLQGTIKADIVETVGGIKTQHNVLEQIGIDPTIYGIKGIIEPLRDLYKHEVRDLAKFLGLTERRYNRQPFPGPGLATRIIGEVTPERVRIIRKATKIVEDEIEKAYKTGIISQEPFQYFPILANDKVTGIRRGKRKLGNMIIIRCVESEDALVASPSKIPYEVLFNIQQRITEEIQEVVKVTYDITPKPPSTIEVI